MTFDAFARLSQGLEPRDVVAEVWSALGYEPNCKPRADARKAGTPEDELPPLCGQCPAELFHAATEYDVLFGGSAGSGKSVALVVDGLVAAIRHPGIRIAAFRRSYDELSESLLRELARLDYAEALGATWNGSERELRFPNGSLVRFRYAETSVDATRRQGGQYQLLILDERTLFAPDVVDLLCERIRSGSSVPVLGIRSASNPGGPGHAQTKKRFVDGTDHGQRVYTDAQGFSVRFIPARVGDNPHVDAAYVRRLEAIPDPARRAAMLSGNWDMFSGQVFQAWSRDRHVVPRFEVPVDWQRFAGIDWGFTAPWCVLWLAVDEDGRVWVYRERYGTRVGESEQAHRIIEAEGGEAVTARYADDAMWTGRGEAKSVADVYIESGCPIVPAHKGERISGWQRVHFYLADGPACLHHRAAGWETCPRLHVLDGTAPNLVRTLPSLPYDPRKPEDVDTHAEDHSADSLRYALINLSDPAGFVFDDTAEPAPSGSVDPFRFEPDDAVANLDFGAERPDGSGGVKASPYV